MGVQTDVADESDEDTFHLTHELSLFSFNYVSQTSKRQHFFNTYMRLCTFSFPFLSVAYTACCYHCHDTRTQKYESDEGSGLDDDDEVLAINSVAAAEATPTDINAPSMVPHSEAATDSSIVPDETLAAVLSSIEQSADAMSPLCVSPMDMDSDTDAASSQTTTG